MKKILLSIILFASLASCKIQLVPTYNAPVVSAAIDARVSCDSLYNAMLHDSSANYADYANAYNFENVKLSNLVLAESVRDHGKILLQQAQRIQNNFKIFQSDHAVNVTLSAPIIRSYKSLMDELFRSYLTAQNNLQNDKP